MGAISLTFGNPEHGWLPVIFTYEDYRLEVDASDVSNDPVINIYNAIIGLESGLPGEVMLWLEPHTYFFSIKKEGASKYILTVSEAEFIEGERKVTKTINGNYSQIIVPLISAVLEFNYKTYEYIHWPYKLDKIQMEQLKDRCFDAQ